MISGEKHQWWVIRPDTSTGILVVAATNAIAEAFVVRKFPLVLICPSCEAKDSIISRSEANADCRILGYSTTNQDFLYGEPSYDSYGDSTFLCLDCGQNFTYMRMENIVSDSQDQLRRDLFQPPALYNSDTAMLEGWRLVNNSNDRNSIKRYDDSGLFETDEEAAAFVKDLADFGSAMHKAVMEFLARVVSVPDAEAE